MIQMNFGKSQPAGPGLHLAVRFVPGGLHGNYPIVNGEFHGNGSPASFPVKIKINIILCRHIVKIFIEDQGVMLPEFIITPGPEFL